MTVSKSDSIRFIHERHYVQCEQLCLGEYLRHWNYKDNILLNKNCTWIILNPFMKTCGCETTILKLFEGKPEYKIAKCAAY